MTRGPGRDVVCFRALPAKARLFDAWVLQNGTTRQAVLEAIFDRWLAEVGLLVAEPGRG